MSFEKGVSTFIERLAKAAKVDIKTGTAVVKLEKNNEGYAVSTHEKIELYDSIVLASSAYESAELLRDIDTSMADRLKSIAYSPISIVGFGYNALAHDLDGFGLLTTTSAHKEILGVLWDSSIFNDRAPDAKKSVRVMIGGQRNADLALKSKEELIAMAQKGIKETMGIDATPDVVFVEQWEKGIPNYAVGHADKVKGLFENLKAHKGLYLNSNAYFGVGLNDCVSNSKKCAQRIVEELVR